MSRGDGPVEAGCADREESGQASVDEIRESDEVVRPGAGVNSKEAAATQAHVGVASKVGSFFRKHWKSICKVICGVIPIASASVYIMTNLQARLECNSWCKGEQTTINRLAGIGVRMKGKGCSLPQENRLVRISVPRNTGSCLFCVKKLAKGGNDEWLLDLAYSGQTSQDMAECYDSWASYISWIKTHSSDLAVEISPTDGECTTFASAPKVPGKACVKFSIGGLRNDQCEASPVLHVTSPEPMVKEFRGVPDAHGTSLDVEIGLRGCDTTETPPICQPPLRYNAIWCSREIEAREINVRSCDYTRPSP